MHFLRNYLLGLALLTVFSVITAMLLRIFLGSWLHQSWSLILGVTVFINLACYVAMAIMLKYFKNDPQAGTFGLLAVVSAHLLLYLIFVLAYFLIAGKPTISFALNLMVFYILFLVFELVSLLNILRPLSNEPKKPF